MAEVALFRTESNQLIHMDLPLPEHMAEKITKGQLRRVNDDGTDYTGDAEGAAQGAAVTVKPAVNAPKAAWVGWAVHKGADADDAEAATKQDLIDTYGQD